MCELSPEEIITKLRECKQGGTVQEAVKQVGVSSSTYFNWRTKYESMSKEENRSEFKLR